MGGCFISLNLWIPTIPCHPLQNPPPFPPRFHGIKLVYAAGRSFPLLTIGLIAVDLTWRIPL